jgi:hypothetical protein
MEVSGMKFTAEGVVTGFTQFKGTIDGDAIDANSLFVMVDLNPAQGGKGQRTEAKRCKDAQVVERIKHLTFPCVCALEMEELATKGKTQLTVIDCKPKAAAKVAA